MDKLYKQLYPNATIKRNHFAYVDASREEPPFEERGLHLEAWA